jgi:hypothetical protein
LLNQQLSERSGSSALLQNEVAESLKMFATPKQSSSERARERARDANFFGSLHFKLHLETIIRVLRLDALYERFFVSSFLKISSLADASLQSFQNSR